MSSAPTECSTHAGEPCTSTAEQHTHRTNRTRNGAAQEHRGTHSIYGAAQEQWRSTGAQRHAQHIWHARQLGTGVLAGSRTHGNSRLVIDVAGHAKGLPASPLHSSGAATAADRRQYSTAQHMEHTTHAASCRRCHICALATAGRVNQQTTARPQAATPSRGGCCCAVFFRFPANFPASRHSATPEEVRTCHKTAFLVDSPGNRTLATRQPFV